MKSCGQSQSFQIYIISNVLGSLSLNFQRLVPCMHHGCVDCMVAWARQDREVDFSCTLCRKTIKRVVASPVFFRDVYVLLKWYQQLLPADCPVERAEGKLKDIDPGGELHKQVKLSVARKRGDASLKGGPYNPDEAEERRAAHAYNIRPGPAVDDDLEDEDFIE